MEIVDFHKVLGLIIQDNLKWDAHIRSIIAKASRRVHIIRILRRSGISQADLAKIYIALIRSILEYKCEVRSNPLTKYQSDKLKRVQKRALRVIFPGHSYDEVLAMWVVKD